jgi:adenosylcobinamide kinase/adenosylcobinamide-phosphate guanylyltransferase
MSGPEVILVGGGARSGKSDLALRLARSRGRRRVFLATAEARDDEMKSRIAQHQLDRGSDFETVECPFDVPEALRRIEADVVVIDCLTLWLSNLLCRGDDVAGVANRVEALASALEWRSFHSIVVTNEVGMGLVPETPLGRVFRDAVGLAHQRIARSADRIYFGALGTMLRLKPAPVAVVGATDDEAPTSEGWTCS